MRRNWLAIGLVASLALNLFLIGAGVGVLALGARLAKQSAITRPGAMFWATQALPQPDRRAFRQALGGLRSAAKAEAERSLSLRAAAWGAVAGASPDAAAIDAQLAQSRAIDVGLRKGIEEKTVAYAVGMSAADRAIFADGMRRALAPAQEAAAPTAAKP